LYLILLLFIEKKTINTVHIIRSTRISLIQHLVNYFTNHGYNLSIIDIKNERQLNQYIAKFRNDVVEYVVFSNGTDKLDRRIYKTLKTINPDQKFLFSENAWLSWQDFIYLDPLGIGNESELYNFTLEDIKNYKINVAQVEYCTNLMKTLLSVGTNCEYENYILVPLQVDNDSKLLIGSPHFKTVRSFVDYMIDITPKDINIFFKNHPNNRNKVDIPTLDNVKDITNSRASKKALIKNSIFVAGINTTFLIESMFLKHKTVTYGLDVFSNKNIIIEGYRKDFDTIVGSKIDNILRDNFIKILMSKQVAKV